jgi:hypothetical protein
MNDERQEAQIMMKIVENLMAPGGKAIQITFQALWAAFRWARA